MTTSTDPALPSIASELAAVKAEHSRADDKAKVVVGFASLAATVLAGTTHGPMALAAGAAWAVSAILAGVVMFPRLSGGVGFVAYAQARSDEEAEVLMAAVNGTNTLLALRLMSVLAFLKYRLVQAAYLVAGVALVLTALVLR